MMCCFFDNATLTVQRRRQAVPRTKVIMMIIGFLSLVPYIMFQPILLTFSSKTSEELPSTSTSTAANDDDDTASTPMPLNPLKGIRILLYLTTHMSETHKWYLKTCWKDALRNSWVLNSSDVFVYLNQDEAMVNETVYEESIMLLQKTFNNDKNTLTIHSVKNAGYQQGAIGALSDASKKKWFNGYDWLIRVNADVIVRNDTILKDVIMRNALGETNISGILIDCYGRGGSDPVVHTDFFAIKPSKLPENGLVVDNTTFSNKYVNAERLFTQQIRDTILQPGRHVWLKDSFPKQNMCRAAANSPDLSQASVIHHHYSSEQMQDSELCPVPF